MTENCPNISQRIPDELRPALQSGKWRSFTVNDKTYELHIAENWTFMNLYVTDSDGKKIKDDDVVHDNVILQIEIHGKWCGVLSATLYDKSTSYHLIDLEKLVTGNEEFDVFVGGVQYGWFKNVYPIDFEIDFKTETLIKNGKTISFSEEFDHYYTDTISL